MPVDIRRFPVKRLKIISSFRCDFNLPSEHVIAISIYRSSWNISIYRPSMSLIFQFTVHHGIFKFTVMVYFNLPFIIEITRLTMSW